MTFTVAIEGFAAESDAGTETADAVSASESAPAKIDTSKITISGVSDAAFGHGSPSVSVIYAGQALVQGKDFVVGSASSRIGEVTSSIEFVGSYSGSMKNAVKYTILLCNDAPEASKVKHDLTADRQELYRYNSSSKDILLGELQGCPYHFASETIPMSSYISKVQSQMYEITDNSYYGNAASSTEIKKLTVPQVSVRKRSSRGCKITWQADKNFSGYKLYRSEDGGKYKLLATITDGSLEYDDKTAEAGKSYSYKLEGLLSLGGRIVDSEMGKETKIDLPEPPKEEPPKKEEKPENNTGSSDNGGSGNTDSGNNDSGSGNTDSGSNDSESGSGGGSGSSGGASGETTGGSTKYKIPVYDAQGNTTEYDWTYTVSASDIKIIEDFIKEHNLSSMSDMEALEYTITWINENVTYDTGYSHVTSSWVESIFVNKYGQCLQYNGAMAVMYAYYGYDTAVIKGYRCNSTGTSKWQHFWTEVYIDGVTYVSESGNYKKYGYWMYFLAPYDWTSGYMKNNKVL